MTDLKRYAVIQQDGRVWSVTLWDGVTPWTPPDGMQAVECAENISRDYIYQNGEFIFSPPLPPVPASVSMFQARETLRRHGLLQTIDSYIANANNDTLSLAWEYATEVHRYGQFVTILAENFNLDQAALDALFIEAGTITA